MAEFKTPCKIKSAKKIIIPPSPFLKQIGYGTGVAVYEMERSPINNKLRSPWAIKKLIKSKGELNNRLKDEAQVLRQLNHENVVGFRAFVKDNKGGNVLAMEECGKSLGDLIEERLEGCGDPFPPIKIFKVMQDISKALDYLHNQALLLHCDIKSYNILVKKDFELCKLCDFGVCLPLNKQGGVDDEEAEFKGTPAWAPPEVLTYPETITSKADIYSFGLVIWELIALSPPVDDKTFNSLDSSGSDDSKILTRLRPDLPDIELGEEYTFILEIYYICTDEDYMKRPSAIDLCKVIGMQKPPT